MNKGYPILQNWLRESIQDLVPVVPTCFVVHSTANPGVGDEAHVRWLNTARQHGWANYYGDHDSIRMVVPEGWRAPAQGPTYNLQALSYEMCEPGRDLSWDEQVRRFHETWNRAAWTAAETCFRFGWGIYQVISHAEVSAKVPNETDHTDPIAFFARYGRTFEDFRADVGALLEELNGAYPEAADWQDGYIIGLMNAGYLSQRRHPNQPVIWWEMAAQNLKLLERIKGLEARLTKLEQA